MHPDTDLEWLVEHRPDPDTPTPASTERARASLVAHSVRRRRVRRRTGTLAAAAVLAAVLAGAAAAIVVTGRSTPKRLQITISAKRPPTPTAVRPRPPQTQVSSNPLVTFAADVRTLPSRPQPGDATLVVRYTVIKRHHEVDGAVYGGYDLYTDAGKYYYAPFSLAQLQQLYDSHQVSLGGGDEAKALRTIAASADGTPAQARAAVLRTLPPPASPAQIRRQLSTVPEPYRRRFLHLLHHATKAQRRLSQDSQVYDAATQALEVGAGRPDVRAASIKALSTLRHVTEKRVRLDGVGALRVDFPDGGTSEIIWLDARTGVPIQEKDGSTSATAFEVKRVDAARLPAQVSPAGRLR
jgi:hypothetical protein